jgi:signal transduction histidine kinase
VISKHLTAWGYDKLSRIGFLSKSYTFKFLFIAFLGIHVPLIGLIIFMLLKTGVISTDTILLITLLLTLGATTATLFVLNGLLAPLRQSRQTLQDYLSAHELPHLPVHYNDEAGQLMQHIQLTLTELNLLLEEKKDLTALLSHDLRTPLRNVQTFADILRQQGLSPEEVKEMALNIEESAAEQQQILENILEILRIDYLFQQNQQLEPIALEELVQDAIHALAPAAHHKGISLAANLHYTGAVEVQPELFKQVLKNLVTNAIKFSHSGSQVKINIYRRNEQTLIDVTDQGIGFDQPTGENFLTASLPAAAKEPKGSPPQGWASILAAKSFATSGVIYRPIVPGMVWALLLRYF